MNKQSNVKVYSIPKVAEAFKCIGSACSMSCCAGWTVDLDKRTFKNYRKNDGLAKYIKKGAADGSRSSTRYGHIQNMPDGTCPMLDEKKMCNVQSILGEKALSQTCNTFPRVIHRSKNDFKITMSLACPEVVRLIVSDEKSMEKTSVYNFK